MMVINAAAVLLIILLLQQPDALAKSDTTYASNTADNTFKSTIKLIVKFKPNSTDNDGHLRSFSTLSNNSSTANKLLSTKVRSISTISNDGHLASVEIYPEDKDMVIHELKNDDNVLFVEEDFEIHKTPAIEEQQHDTPAGNLRRTLEEVEQYGNSLIQTPEILRTIASKPNLYINTPVKVCIIDTGYNIDHEDLPKDHVTQTDVGYGSSFFDNDGHGTHCAGVIGAVGGNGRGVVGVIPDDKLFSFHIVKALNDDGTGNALAMLRAIQGCIHNGSKIISMSIGSSFQSAIFRDEFERAYNEGVLLVSASGNKGEAVYDYPASYESVISVGAVDWHGNRAEFSNYNDQVELLAPGVSIKSTYRSSDGYRKLSGTSMATPFVVGAMALVWGYFPTCSNQQMRNVFARTAKQISSDPSGCDEKNGYGIIQAKAAFDALQRFGCEFGGEDSIPKSLGALGGCQQLRSITDKTLALTAPTLHLTDKTTPPSFATLQPSVSPSNLITLSNITWTPTPTDTEKTASPSFALTASALSPSNPVISNITWTTTPTAKPTTTQVTSFTVRPSINPTHGPPDSPTNPLTLQPTIPPTIPPLPLTSSPSNSVSLIGFATALTPISPSDRTSSNQTTDEPTLLTASVAPTNIPTAIGPTVSNQTDQTILTDQNMFLPFASPSIASNVYTAASSSSSSSSTSHMLSFTLYLATSLTILWFIC